MNGKKPNMQEVLQWSVEELASWMSKNKFGEAKEIVKRSRINGREFLKTALNEVKTKFNLSNDKAKKLRNILDSLQQEYEGTPSDDSFDDLEDTDFIEETPLYELEMPKSLATKGGEQHLEKPLPPPPFSPVYPGVDEEYLNEDEAHRLMNRYNDTNEEDDDLYPNNFEDVDQAPQRQVLRSAAERPTEPVGRPLTVKYAIPVPTSTRATQPTNLTISPPIPTFPRLPTVPPPPTPTFQPAPPNVLPTSPVPNQSSSCHEIYECSDDVDDPEDYEVSNCNDIPLTKTKLEKPVFRKNNLEINNNINNKKLNKVKNKNNNTKNNKKTEISVETGLDDYEMINEFIPVIPSRRNDKAPSVQVPNNDQISDDYEILDISPTPPPPPRRPMEQRPAQARPIMGRPVRGDIMLKISNSIILDRKDNLRKIISPNTSSPKSPHTAGFTFPQNDLNKSDFQAPKQLQKTPPVTKTPRQAILPPQSKIPYQQKLSPQPKLPPPYLAIPFNPPCHVMSKDLSTIQKSPPQTPSFSNKPDKSWYREVGRDEATNFVEKKKQNGNFVIRPSDKQADRPYTLVVYIHGVRYVPIRRIQDGTLALGLTQKPNEKTFGSLEEMVEHYRHKEIYVESGGEKKSARLL